MPVTLATVRKALGIGSTASSMPIASAGNPAAAKTGATDRAISLYERLLKVDPNNAVALAYLANNKPGGAEPSNPEPAPTPAPEGGG